jgi:DNA-binding transcriptional ArsR family regulator
MTRTPDLLAALGSPDGIELLLALIAADRQVGELTAASGIPQPTASRRLAALERVGVLEHKRRGSPFRVTERAALCDLLFRISHLAEKLPGGDPQAEQAFRDRLRASGCNESS